MVPKFNENPDKDNADKEEELEMTKSGQKSSTHASIAAEEEKINWAYCPVCHGIGEEGRKCSNCEDMGMIYNVPIKDYKPPNLENHKDLNAEAQDKLNEVEDVELPNSENHKDLDDKQFEEVKESQEL